MPKQIYVVVFLAIATTLGPTSASSQTAAPSNRSNPATSNQKITQAEQRFLTEAIQGDLAEVNIGKLAQEKGQADEVKQFGQMLEQDHGDHLKQAEQMAEQMGITAPNSPSAKQQAIHEKLEKLSGSAFDKEFKQAMVKDHQEDVAKYRREAKGKGPLAQFAQETVPTLEKHLKQAQALGRPAPTTGKGTNR
jgi:putative membrane protein